jgi:hypothetical protein
VGIKVMDYQAAYNLSKEDIKIIDENITKANKVFKEIEYLPNTIKENCESPAIKKYLNSL